MIGISACLTGKACRYDGQHKKIKEMAELSATNQAILICPEVEGGLSIPRNPAEIVGGDGMDVWSGDAKVIDCIGQDVTEAFKNGAVTCFKRLREQQINTVILKDASPACGSCQIYNGQFSGVKTDGIGVAAAYFQKNGLKVYSEKEWLAQNKKE